MIRTAAVAFVAIPWVALAEADQVAAQHAPTAGAPYAGMQARAVKSLSDQDIVELRRGGGWGLALPAELNGVPGPAHLLELRAPLGLTASQVEALKAISAAMTAEAVAAGARFIEAEAALDAAFRDGAPTPERLRALIDEAAAARGVLRMTHLSRHLETLPLLTSEQIDRYAALRGYGGAPCASVPQGHDPVTWRRHNGCGD
jgi:hypothetical protein